MRTILLFAASSLFALGGCAVSPTVKESADQGPPDAARVKAVKQVVSDNVSQFFAGMSRSTCDDGAPVSRFAKDGTIYVTDDEVMTVSRADYDAGVEYRACNWAKHDGGVDSILVDVMAPNVANAAWTYHDVITLKDGKVRRTRGAVLQTWKKEDGNWLIAATMSDETLISQK